MANEVKLRRIRLMINGVERPILCDPQKDTLAVALRRMGLTGTKVGCGIGGCGACSVILNGEVVRACTKKMKTIEEHSEILTIEGIGTPQHLHPLQQAWITYGGAQCGFCTPGFIVSAYGLLKSNPSPTREEVRAWFQAHHNVCRCTGYKPLVDAVMAAAAVMRGERTMEDITYKNVGEDYYGSKLPRPTALAKVTGLTDYGDDVALKMPTERAELAVVMPDVSHAKIKSVDEIDNFDTLKAVADDMQAKKDQLGIKGAFTSAGFDSSSDWRFKTHLANLPLYYEFTKDNITEQPETIKGTYLPEYKNIFDLYITDSTTDRTQLSSKTGDDANSEFALGQAAFYQNGTWAWTDLQKAGMKADSISMMPIYTGVKGEEKQGLATGSENYWCINDKASDADKQATKDFLKWVITSKTGKKSLSQDMGFTTPFKSFSDVKSDNPLVQAAQDDQKSGKTQVSWNFTMMPSEEWKNKLGNALLEYAQGTGDWNAVKTAFVDNWAAEYKASH